MLKSNTAKRKNCTCISLHAKFSAFLLQEKVLNHFNSCHPKGHSVQMTDLTFTVCCLVLLLIEKSLFSTVFYSHAHFSKIHSCLFQRPLGPENLLLRGARLKNTREIFGESVSFGRKKIVGANNHPIIYWNNLQVQTAISVWCPYLGCVMRDNASGFRIDWTRQNQSHHDDCMFADSNITLVCRI